MDTVRQVNLRYGITSVEFENCNMRRLVSYAGHRKRQTWGINLWPQKYRPKSIVCWDFTI